MSFTPVPGVAYDCCAFPDPAGSIAVCCLWGVVDRVAAQYARVCLVGPCVSPAGVDHILRTLRANPQITIFAVEGPDLSGTRALLDAAIRMSGLLDFVTESPPGQRLYHLLLNRAQVIDPVPPPPPGTVGTRRGPPARTFTGASVFAVWPRLLGEIVRHGAESPTAYGTKQRELLAASWTFGVVATLEGVPEWYAAAFPVPALVWNESEGAWEYWTQQIAPGVSWGCDLNTDGSWHTRRGGFDYQDITLGDFTLLTEAKAAVEEHVASPAGAAERLDAYASMHFVGDVDERPEGAAYTYADRLLTRWDNQIVRCMEVLRADAEQRRAVAVTWDTGGLTPQHPDSECGRCGGSGEAPYCPACQEARPSDAAAANPPCLTHLWFRRDNDGSLYTHATFRSHDVLRAGIPNAWGLCRLAEHVAGELGWPVGKLTISSLSAHVYSDGYEQAETLAQAHGRNVYEEDDRAVLRVRAVPADGLTLACPVCAAPIGVACPFGISHGERVYEARAGVAVDLLLPDGRTAATIESSTAAGAEQRVLRAGWVTTLSHAAWLGRELARVEAP